VLLCLKSRYWGINPQFGWVTYSIGQNNSIILSPPWGPYSRKGASIIVSHKNWEQPKKGGGEERGFKKEEAKFPLVSPKKWVRHLLAWAWLWCLRSWITSTQSTIVDCYLKTPHNPRFKEGVKQHKKDCQKTWNCIFWCAANLTFSNFRSLPPTPNQIYSWIWYVFSLFLRQFHSVDPFNGNFCGPSPLRWEKDGISISGMSAKRILFHFQVYPSMKSHLLTPSAMHEGLSVDVIRDPRDLCSACLKT